MNKNFVPAAGLLLALGGCAPFWSGGRVMDRMSEAARTRPADVTQVIIPMVPPGSDVSAAERLMQQNGFACWRAVPPRERLNRQPAVDAYSQCDTQRTTGFLTLDTYSVTMLTLNETIVELHASVLQDTYHF